MCIRDREWFDLIHPDEHATLAQRALDRQRLEPVPSRYEVRLRRKDGSVRWVEVSVSLVGFDGDAVTIGTAYDVTERREILQRLRESEQRHRLLADNASDVIWTMDLGGRFTYVSPSVEKLRGYAVAEVMQQSMDQVLTPDSLATFTLKFAEAVEAMSRGETFPTVRAEVEQPCKDGSTVWTEVTASGIVDEAGEFMGILGVSRDVTERRRDALRLQHMAQYDLLTDLPNRALLLDRLGLALAVGRIVAEKVRLAIAEPIVVAGHRVKVSSTVGLALFPEHGEDADALLRCADTAMYAAKAEGRDRVVVWTSALAAPQTSWDTPVAGTDPIART